MSKYCSQCGNECKDNAKFCSVCGKAFPEGTVYEDEVYNRFYAETGAGEGMMVPVNGRNADRPDKQGITAFGKAKEIFGITDKKRERKLGATCFACGKRIGMLDVKAEMLDYNFCTNCYVKISYGMEPYNRARKNTPAARRSFEYLFKLQNAKNVIEGSDYPEQAKTAMLNKLSIEENQCRQIITQSSKLDSTQEILEMANNARMIADVLGYSSGNPR